MEKSSSDISKKHIYFLNFNTLYLRSQAFPEKSSYFYVNLYQPEFIRINETQKHIYNSKLLCSRAKGLKTMFYNILKGAL